MKRLKGLMIMSLVVLMLFGCQSNISSQSTKTEQHDKDIISLKDKKVLIAYFTRANNIEQEENVDTTSSASLLERNGKIVGNTGFVAEVIKEETGGTLFTITLSEKYMSDYDSLNDIAREEGNKGIRPKLNSAVENLSQYDVIFLGYPNWWFDMPMAVYSFLDENDLSNKTVIPFVTHGGSKFSNTIETLKTMYQDTNVLAGIDIYQHDVINSEDDIREWLKVFY